MSPLSASVKTVAHRPRLAFLIFFALPLTSLFLLGAILYPSAPVAPGYGPAIWCAGPEIVTPDPLLQPPLCSTWVSPTVCLYLESAPNPTIFGEPVQFTVSMGSGYGASSLSSRGLDIPPFPHYATLYFYDGLAHPNYQVDMLYGGGTTTFTPQVHGVITTYADYGSPVGPLRSQMILQVVMARPLTVDDTAGALAGQEIVLNLLDGDSSPDTCAVALLNVATPAHGQVTMIDTNHIAYISQSQFTGLDTFPYIVADSRGLTETAMVRVVIASPAQSDTPPVVITANPTETVNWQVDSSPISITLSIPPEVYPISTTRELPIFAYTKVITPAVGVAAAMPEQSVVVYLFSLAAYQNGVSYGNAQFAVPVTVTIDYGGAMDGTPAEDTLRLLGWDEDTQSWSERGVSLINHDSGRDRLIYSLHRPTLYALVGRNLLYLPIVNGNE